MITVRQRERCHVTTKPETIGTHHVPVPAVETAGEAASGLFDFGAPSGVRKRLFQFAKPSLAKRGRKTALGPSRSEYGCD